MSSTLNWAIDVRSIETGKELDRDERNPQLLRGVRSVEKDEGLDRDKLNPQLLRGVRSIEMGKELNRDASPAQRCEEHRDR